MSRDGFIFETDLPFRGFHEPHDGFHRGGLSRAVRSDKGHDFPFRNREADAFQRRDISIAGDNILKRMGRRTSKQELTDIVAKLRREIPDIALRTTLITGFPGETDKDHEEVMRFIDECEFDRLGVFTYSREEDTVAAQMPDQIDEAIKEKYRDELMQLQQEISADRSAAMIGRIVRVMIEGFIPEDNTYVGRSYKDAPNVDGLVFVECDRELMSGDFIDVKITGSTEYDLIGTIVE